MELHLFEAATYDVRNLGTAKSTYILIMFSLTYFIFRTCLTNTWYGDSLLSFKYKYFPT